MLQRVRNVLFKGSNLLKWNKNTMRHTEKDQKLGQYKRETGTKPFAQSHLAKICTHSLVRMNWNSGLIIIFKVYHIRLYLCLPNTNSAYFHLIMWIQSKLKFKVKDPFSFCRSCDSRLTCNPINYCRQNSGADIISFRKIPWYVPVIINSSYLLTKWHYI